MIGIVGVGIFRCNSSSFSYSAYMYSKICILTYRGISGTAFHEKKAICHCNLVSHSTFVATMSTRKIISCKSESSTRRACKYIPRTRLLCLIFVNKIKNVSLCPRLLTTDREKKKPYTSSHLPRFMFIFALCLLNEPFKQSRSIFTIFSYSIFTIFYIFYVVQLKKIYIHRLFIQSMPFSIFCDTICGNHFRSWDHLRSNLGIILRYWDHLRPGIICGPVVRTPSPEAK